MRACSAFPAGTTKAAVVDKLRDLRTQLDKGVTPKAGYARYIVRQAAGDWLAIPAGKQSHPADPPGHHATRPIHQPPPVQIPASLPI